MDVGSIRHVLSFVGGTAVGLAWVHWGFSWTLVIVFVALVLLDVVLWVRQKYGDERPPQIED